MLGTAIVIGAVLLVCLLLVLAERLFLSPRALLTVEDVVVPVGAPATLRVEVERDILPLWDPPLRGVEVTFHAIEPAGRRPVGTAKTDAHGIAQLSLPPADAPGRSRYAASLAGPLKADDAALIVDVLASDASVFVIDIDGTVADVHPVVHALRENDKIRVVPGAPEAVRALVGRYAVVFLTARDHVFRAKTLDWLQANGFPEAPVVLRRKRVWSQKAAEHKRERLAELGSHARLAVGVGDLPADAAVYRERNMRAYLLGRARADGAIAVPDWKALLDDLMRAGLMPEAVSAAAPPPPSSPSRT